MCKENMKRYYKLMSCVTLIVMLAMLVGQIIHVVDQFKVSAGAWPIISTFLNMLATLTLGSALANLFWSHSYVLKTSDECEECDID